MTAGTVTAMVPDGELGSAEASRCSHDFVTSGVTTAIHWPKVSPTLQL
jgi:predicted carbohydrate-binding protein with CBM5 and CBM33 domain